MNHAPKMTESMPTTTSIPTMTNLTPGMANSMPKPANPVPTAANLTPTKSMLEKAAKRFDCAEKDLAFWPIENLPGAFFFSTGEMMGGSRLLINATGEELWRPSSYSEKRHLSDYAKGLRN